MRWRYSHWGLRPVWTAGPAATQASVAVVSRGEVGGLGFLSASSNVEVHQSNSDQIKQTSRSSTALREGEEAGGGGLVNGERKTGGNDRKRKTRRRRRRRRREVEQSPFCTFLRKNWRSERAVFLMPIIKMGASRVEIGLVCEMEAHTHTFTSWHRRKRGVHASDFRVFTAGCSFFVLFPV